MSTLSLMLPCFSDILRLRNGTGAGDHTAHFKLNTPHKVRQLYGEARKARNDAKCYRIEVTIVTELVLDTNTLPEPLFRLIKAERVKVNEANGIINLIPIIDPKKDRSTAFGCLRGKITVPDNFNEPLDDFKEYMQ